MSSHSTLTLSIIIPAYNEEDHIVECLESIAAQTIMPDEVIVVDNNSKDNTFKLAKNYPFVRVIKEKRQGVVFARDKGFNAAKSDIIGRIDADSVLPADWVQQIKEFYERGDHMDYCYSGNAYFYNLKFPGLTSWWQGQIAFRLNRLIMGHYILYGSNMAIPRHIWQKVRGKVCHDQDIHEDLNLAIHVHRAGYKITYRETLQVGVKMRRVFENRGDLWENLMLWPQTIRKHGRPTWVIGWIGALLLYVAAYTIRPIMKKSTRPD